MAIDNVETPAGTVVMSTKIVSEHRVDCSASSLRCSVDSAGDWSAGSPLLLSLESASWGAGSCVPPSLSLSLCLDKTNRPPLEYATH
ncbi:hypothetical protein NQZ68_012210 [Dissostichus eleginoides]|nr:hypothetical protein NQZ68_012210 [Dissostichus eleginoides]